MMSDAPHGLRATAYCGDAARNYDEQRFATPQGRLFSRLEFQQLADAVRDLDIAARILEVGCGTARFSENLARRGYSVVATDPSSDMIAAASRKCSGLETIRFQCEEGARLSFADGTFDFVFSIRVTNQTESEEYALRMIAEMIRVTRSGGRILVEFVNRRRPLRKRSQTVRLSFGQIDRFARERGCRVERRRGILVFSQSVLDRIPDPLVPAWGGAERMAARVFWRWASRGYVLLKKP